MKIKDNLNLNGYILQNFCIDNYDSLDGINDKGTGRAVFLTGNSTNAGYGHVNVYDGTSFKALAYVDDVANNEEFLAVKRKVDAFFDGGVDADNVLENLAEVQKFLDNYSGATSLSQILDTKFDKAGGTIESSAVSPLCIDTTHASANYITFLSSGTAKSYVGWNLNLGVFLQNENGDQFHIINGNAKLNDKTLLTSAGGTIESENYDAFKIKRTADAGAYITFENKNGRLGSIGFEQSTNKPILYRGATTSQIDYILHSGNVGDYALKYQSVSLPDNIKSGFGYNSEPSGYPHTGGFATFGNGAYGFQIMGHAPGAKLSARGLNNGTWSDWKQIAFTDSNVAGARKLRTDNDTIYATFNDTAKIISFAGDSGLADYITFIGGKTITLRYGASATNGFLLNSSGNVLIGTTEDNGAKLQVSGDVQTNHIKSLSGLDITAHSEGEGSRLFLTTNSFRPWGSDNGKIDLGSPDIRWRTLYAEGAYIAQGAIIKGDLHVSGNIIADGEVSAGGAGEEGGGSSSGGGGAFHSEGIAVGATQTTIAHGLGTDDIVVSIYEKDGVSGRWSIILTDVEIVDANNIIVSFGSATTVEHKVVIMGAVA